MSRDRRSEINAKVAGLGLSELLNAPAQAQRHPLDDFGFQVSEDLYLIDPKRIVLEGPYVREFLPDDETFRAFVAAVAEEGEIKQPIGIRTAGPPTDRRYILVYGMRRWKAALAAGLPKIAVRDYGELSDAESISVQMIENEARADPHPVDTAVGYHLMVERGGTQSDAARVTGRDRSYVSVMRAVGEAISGMSTKDRAALYESGAATVRTFQSIAKLDGVRARQAALRKLLAETSRREPKPQERPIARGRALRDGRSFRLEWREKDLQKDPLGFADTLLAALREEQQMVVERLRAMIQAAESEERDAKELRQALERIEQVGSTPQ